MATPATAKKQFFFTALAAAVGAFVLASSANAQEPSDAPIIRNEPGKMELKAPDLENGLNCPAAMSDMPSDRRAAECDRARGRTELRKHRQSSRSIDPATNELADRTACANAQCASDTPRDPRPLGIYPFAPQGEVKHAPPAGSQQRLPASTSVLPVLASAIGETIKCRSGSGRSRAGARSASLGGCSEAFHQRQGTLRPELR